MYLKMATLIANYYGCINYDNKRIIVAIFYLKMVLDKKYFKNFISELNKIFGCYKEKFSTVEFSNILSIMGIDQVELNKMI